MVRERSDLATNLNLRLQNSNLGLPEPFVCVSAHRHTTVRNFRVVEDGVFYRSGQLSPEVFQRTLDEYGIKLVITLRTVRDPSLPYPDEWEARICAERNVKHVRLVPKVWGANEKGEIPANANVKAFLELMDAPANHPVLIHCFAGIHRTGTMCALFRMDFHHWSADRAIVEMRICASIPKTCTNTSKATSATSSRAPSNYVTGCWLLVDSVL